MIDWNTKRICGSGEHVEDGIEQLAWHALNDPVELVTIDHVTAYEMWTDHLAGIPR